MLLSILQHKYFKSSSENTQCDRKGGTMYGGPAVTHSSEAFVMNLRIMSVWNCVNWRELGW